MTTELNPLLKAVPGIILEDECDICENKQGHLHLWHCVLRDPDHYEDRNGGNVYTGPTPIEAAALRKKNGALHFALKQLGVQVQDGEWHLHSCFAARLVHNELDCIPACRRAREALKTP